MSATRSALERAKELMRRYWWARQTLPLEVTVPTVLLVAALSAGSALVIGRQVNRIHEEEARRQSARFMDALAQAYRRNAPRGHPALQAMLDTACAAATQSAFVADAAGEVTMACDERLVGTALGRREADAIRLERGGERYSRSIRPVASEPACAPCHPGAGTMAYVGVDWPLAGQEAEARGQLRSNLVAGGLLVAAVAGLLVLIQLAFVYRPVKRLTETVERIRAGDLSVRLATARQDELGRLAASVNEMAASLERAKVELDRTHRAELAQSEKLAALGKLFTSVAHEIKNQLTGVLSAMRVLEVEYPEGDPNKPVLEKIVFQMERMSHTAVSALDFARPLKPGVGPVDVAELLEQALFFIERQAQEQRVELRRRYSTALPRARIDADLMKQVFLNILINGLQAMPSGGALEVETRRAGPHAVEVAISDQGVGIPPENVERIFSPFFSTKANGTGLGLYVARQIVDTQQGAIRVESRPGEGSRFVIALPADPAPEEGGDRASG